MGDMRVKCPRCGYEWEYKGRRQAVTCPNCLHKFRVDLGQVEQAKAETKDLGNGVFLIKLPEKDIDKVKQVELWKKAGAKVIESTKDDRVAIVEVPDDKADEVIRRFSELLEQELKAKNQNSTANTA